ncbi:MAG TPA: phosphodiester glycosidase family protein [Ilumatobacteraceae bacterium]
MTKIVVLVFIVWNGVSFAHYVLKDNGDTTSGKMATWARDHHLGGEVDWLEAHIYDTPPSAKPAKQLALAMPGLVPPVVLATTSTAPVITAATSLTAEPASTTTTVLSGGTIPTIAVATSVSDPTATTVALPAPIPPSPIAPLIAPALQDEGQWVPIARADGEDAIWATSVRPLPDAGSVVASIAEIDQTYIRAGLFNGSEEPGGAWKRGNRVPDSLQPALLAAFNGGFRFEHMKGGYETEGVVVKPLRNGDATLAIGKDGKLVLGQLDRDLFDDGSWLSLRQNLILIVDGGKSQVQEGINEGVWWGADYGKEVYVPRSAVCQMPDGRLAYVLVAPVDAFQLAQALINIGCTKAIQLDINGTWPAFFTFGPDKHGGLVGHPLDTRMGGNPYRYVSGSSKEFFAFFDATEVPPGTILDD